MTELELTRSPDDRRLYVLGGVGTLRFHGLSSRTATADAGDATWRIERRGVFRTVVEAVDAAGVTVAEFRATGWRRGGSLRWAGRALALRPASAWRERYALAEGDRELAVFDGKSWGRRPVEVIVDEAETVEPGLLLFGAFVVRSLAADAASVAATTASTSATVG